MSDTNHRESCFSAAHLHSAHVHESRSVFFAARVLVTALSLVFFLLSGCGKSEPPPQSADDANEEGPLEKAGKWTDEKAEKAVQKTGPALKDAGAAMDEAAEKTSSAIDEALDNPRAQPQGDAREESEEGSEADKTQ